MKLVRESIYNFHKTGDVKSSLGIGRVAEIRELFRSVGIPDEDYEITDTEVIFREGLDLSETSITSLPDGLSVRKSLDLTETLITSLPEGLSVGRYIYVNSSQKDLISFIKSSRFADKLKIW